jgi:AraC-like DNA-binding protein
MKGTPIENDGFSEKSLILERQSCCDTDILLKEKDVGTSGNPKILKFVRPLKKPLFMPLYMDFHKFDHITIEEVTKAHIADESVQDQFGVKYHQFWVNIDAGTVFCLTEGPDMEACEAVHRVAHGNIACAMVEIDPRFYKIFMGEGHSISRGGYVQRSDGAPDLGYRIILVVGIHERKRTGTLKGKAAGLNTGTGARKLVVDTILRFKGREIKWATDDSLIGVFNDSGDAIQCALEIQHQLESEKEVSFKMGIAAGQPVTRNAEFFTEAIRQAHHLNKIAGEREVLISSLVKNLCKDETLFERKNRSVKTMKECDEVFVSELVTVTEKKLGDDTFTIATLCHELGLSRPQLYRKITSIAGRSPNDLIRDIRMEQALNLLKRKSFNISEVALEVGYNNASYFSKCFSEKFGCTPSQYVDAL